MNQKRESKLALLLTATVDVAVKNGNFTSSERMAMYTSTLRYYAKTLGRSVPIIVVENSNADLNPWREEFRDTLDLTIFQFRPDDAKAYAGFDPSRGKGYNEYLMISKAVALMANTPPRQEVTHLLKITGRYSMVNIRSILREIDRRCLRRDILFMGDTKDTTFYRRSMAAMRAVARPFKLRVEDNRIYRKLNHSETFANNWCDSRFFVVTVDYYREALMDFYSDMNDYQFGSIAEHRLCRMLRRHRGDRRFICRFATQVRFDGFSGMPCVNGPYRHDSPSAKRTACVRQFCRILLPNLWI